MKRDSVYSQIYIVRVWRESDTGTSAWRFAVEETATGERHGFCQLADVAGHIGAELEATSDGKPNPAGRQHHGYQDDAVKEDKTPPMTKTI